LSDFVFFNLFDLLLCFRDDHLLVVASGKETKADKAAPIAEPLSLAEVPVIYPKLQQLHAVSFLLLGREHVVCSFDGHERKWKNALSQVYLYVRGGLSSSMAYIFFIPIKQN